jgi:predicted RND superfamily exporter protein
VLLASAALTAGALVLRADIQVGDIAPGAPELRPDSVYNRDVAFVTSNFRLSNDQFVLMLTSKPDECMSFDSQSYADFVSAELRQVEGVRNVFSAADGLRMATSGAFEGNPKWMTLPRNVSNLRTAYGNFANGRPDITDGRCAVLPIIASLQDHKATTLTRLVEATQAYARANPIADHELQLAAGNAGIEAATNIVVKESFWTMHFVLYGAVVLLCLVTFRSWRATLVALIPLVITSLLCEALMAQLGIGLKVATLPVIAVGVGVGVDYALYLLSVQLAAQRRGVSLRDAYMESLNFTGRIVALVGITLSVGVVTWVGSPIKFQADMGILLTFMFLWNMVGALTMIPALSHWLLPGPATGGAKEHLPASKLCME